MNYCNYLHFIFLSIEMLSHSRRSVFRNYLNWVRVKYLSNFIFALIASHCATLKCRLFSQQKSNRSASCKRD